MQGGKKEGEGKSKKTRIESRNAPTRYLGKSIAGHSNHPHLCSLLISSGKSDWGESRTKHGEETKKRKEKRQVNEASG